MSWLQHAWRDNEPINHPPAGSWVGENSNSVSLAWVSFTEGWYFLETRLFGTINYLIQFTFLCIWLIVSQEISMDFI